jgi:hypothetical protein
MWPGSPGRGPLAASQDISATEVIWDFFKGHPKLRLGPNGK